MTYPVDLLTTKRNRRMIAKSGRNGMTEDDRQERIDGMMQDFWADLEKA